jgi:hypothetical protein
MVSSVSLKKITDERLEAPSMPNIDGLQIFDQKIKPTPKHHSIQPVKTILLPGQWTRLPRNNGM